MNTNNGIFCMAILSWNLMVGTGFSYNYFDEMAQTYCASRMGQPSFVFAIRRDCAGYGPRCDHICSNAAGAILGRINHQRSRVKCFDGIHIGKSHAHLADNPSSAQPDAGKVNMFTYGYGQRGCTWKANHCGPNYCCCRAF